ncbi:MAG: GNAT family N-acetyltransferase [Candidatus Heimdallarchaeaceae archaeon]
MPNTENLELLRFLLDSNEYDFYYFMPNSIAKKNDLGFFIKNKTIETYSYVTPTSLGEDNFSEFLSYTFSFFSDGDDYFTLKLSYDDPFFARNSKILRNKQLIPYYQDISVMILENFSLSSFSSFSDLELIKLNSSNLDRWVDVFFDAFSYPKKLKKYISKMVKLQEENGVEFYVAHKFAKDVSCFCSFDSHSLIGLYGVGTRKQYRRRGYASVMLSKFFVQELEKNPQTRFGLQVQKNSGAETLYKKLGFRIVHTQKRFDWNPSILETST